MSWAITYYSESVQEEILTIKKTDRTPPGELAKARRRMKEVKDAHTQRT
jgi:phage-related protein